MSERRKTYREQRGLESIQVSVAVDEGDFLPVALLDLSARGAAVEITAQAHRDQLLSLPVGTNLYMRFELSGADAIPPIRGVLRNVRDDAAGLVCGLEIIDWRTLHAKLPPRLFSAFNRRRHFRVDVPQLAGIEVKVTQQDGEQGSAVLANISLGGCQLMFATGSAPETSVRLQLRFSLPGSDYSFDLAGTVRSAAEGKNAIRCGIEFETLQARPEKEISQYVMQRQRESRVVA